MAQRFDPANMARLDSPERKRILPPEAVLGELGLSPGDIMIDVGAGVGYFAIPAAGMVGTAGRVIALDSSAEMRDELARRIESEGIRNVEARLSEDYAFGLRDGIANLALLATVLHEVQDPLRLLEETARALRVGGRIGIVEWRPVASDRGPRLAERIAPEETIRLLGEAGFVSAHSRDLNEHFYLAGAISL